MPIIKEAGVEARAYLEKSECIARSIGCPRCESGRGKHGVDGDHLLERESGKGKEGEKWWHVMRKPVVE